VLHFIDARVVFTLHIFILFLKLNQLPSVIAIMSSTEYYNHMLMVMAREIEESITARI
jgi:hypothetical protein